METPSHSADVQALRDLVASPTWVRVAGYAIEKIHTGVLVHALGGAGQHVTTPPASRALLAAMWKRATGREVSADRIEGVFVAVEEHVDHGRDSVIDLLVRFDADTRRYRLGIEAKVDSQPRAEQLDSEFKGIKKRPGHENALVLLALGAAQACYLGQSEARRWSIDDILSLREHVVAAALPHIVQPWLSELEAELLRRQIAWRVSASDAGALGYRGRSHAVYQHERIARELEGHGGGPWQVKILPRNVVATASSSYRKRDGSWIYLELADGELCLKAGQSPEAKLDLPGVFKDVVDATRAGLEAKGRTVSAPRARPGDSATLLKVPVDLTSAPAAEDVREAAEVYLTSAAHLVLSKG